MSNLHHLHLYSGHNLVFLLWYFLKEIATFQEFCLFKNGCYSQKIVSLIEETVTLITEV